MKTTEENESAKSPKHDTTSDTDNKPANDEPIVEPPSGEGSSSAPSTSEPSKDKLFEPTVDMLVNDFDDEQTLEEEENLAAKEQVDPTDELSDLQKEGTMPIEELLRLYGCAAAPMASNSAGTSRKRRRRNEKTSQSSKVPIKKVATDNLTEKSKEDQQQQQQISTTMEEIAEESLEEDATTTTTTTTNNLENQSINDDETNFDEDEPSELNKLYTDIFDKETKDGVLKLEATQSDEEDLDYSPDEDEGKKTIMVGSDYQAVIPEGLCKYDDALPYENEDKLLWDPSKLADDEIEDYLNKFTTFACTQNPTATNGATINNVLQSDGKHLRDDEQALFLLLQCGNNYEEALRRRRLGAVQPITQMSIWSEEECRNFENGLRMYGKRFHEIQASKVRTRSVGECVQFYYLWKKTERHDVFANKQRLEKKKYSLNPCVTDFMDKFLDEIDHNGGSNRDRSVSPNSSLLLTDNKRHRHDSSAHCEKQQPPTDGKLSKPEESTEIKAE